MDAVLVLDNGVARYNLAALSLSKKLAGLG